MIEVPAASIALARQFEGFHRVTKFDAQQRAYPYICPAGFWTIGYGHLCDQQHPPITQAQAEVYLARDLMTALTGTLALLPCARQRT